MNKLSWKTAGQCLLQEQLHVGYPRNEDASKQRTHVARMYESCTKTWQWRNKAAFITTRLFAQTSAEQNHIFSCLVFWATYHSWEGGHFRPANSLLIPALSSRFLFLLYVSSTFKHDKHRVLLDHSKSQNGFTFLNFGNQLYYCNASWMEEMVSYP